MTHSESIDQLAAALATAQSQIKGASRDSANPFFKSKYADLASVREACIGPLTANGLSVVQTPSTSPEGHVALTTLLLHSSGQWIADTLTVAPKDDGPQAMGSAITYARRYALAAFAGVAPEDDDGEAAEGRIEGKPTAQPVGKAYIKDVKADPTTNPRVTRYAITFSDGRKAATIKDEWGMVAREQVKLPESDRLLVDATIVRGKFGNELTAFRVVPDLAPADAPF